MELRQLQIFCTAAKMLNFTKAGQTLGYTQSNITGQIRQLESHLHIKLFERLGRSIQLTAEGRRFLPKAEAILQLCQSAKDEFSPPAFRGIINIGAAESLCVYRLPQILSRYRALYPLVEIRVQTESCETFVDLLKNNDLDIAMVLTDKPKWPELKVQVLHNEAMSIVASPHHPLAGYKKVHPSQLAPHCLIITLPGCGYRPLVLAMLASCQVRPEAFMELSSIGAIKECAICGLGVAILPRVAIQRELAANTLVELNWTGPSIDVKTQLIYHRDKWLTPVMHSFLELCQSSVLYKENE